jgi:drug/metabolite transporter (DMT)-like permease
MRLASSDKAGYGGLTGLVGIVLVIVSTVSIALVPSLARLAYDGGSDTLTVITFRSVVSILLTALLMAVLGLPFRIGRRASAVAAGTGLLYGAMLYGYLGAVNYLPVNLVVLIYFIHPLLVGLAGAAFGLERVTVAMLALLATALIGLALAIGANVDIVDFRGLALAAMAMVLAALVILGNAAATKSAPAISICLYMFIAAAVALSVPLLFRASVAVPDSSSGWWALFGVAILFTLGTLTFFIGMGFIGATRAAMISNIEPVLGVIFAVVILGESLHTVQIIGVALVFGSIFAMEFLRRAQG